MNVIFQEILSYNWKKKPKKPGKEKGNKQQKSPNPQGCVCVCLFLTDLETVSNLLILI